CIRLGSARQAAKAVPRGGSGAVSRRGGRRRWPVTPPHPDSNSVILILRAAPDGPDQRGRSPEARLCLLLMHCPRLYGWRVVTLDLPPAASAHRERDAR